MEAISEVFASSDHIPCQMLLHRGETQESVFSHVPTGWNDEGLFAIVWGTVAFLNFRRGGKLDF